MSNYPAGVTGNEWQIAGVYYDDVETVECPECEKDVEANAVLYYRHDEQKHYECRECGYEWSVYDGPDEEDYYKDRDYD